MANPSVVLVIVAATASGIYKCVMAQPFSKDVRRWVMNIHAFTIEVLQLLVLLATFIDVYYVYNQILSSPSHNIDDSSPTFLSVLLRGTVCLFAIDVMDNLIQLGRFTHPVQSQTLILTRSWLFPGSVLVRRKTTKTVRVVSVKRNETPLISMSEVKERSLRRRLSESTTPTKVKCATVRRRSIVTTPVVRFDSAPEKVSNRPTHTYDVSVTVLGLRTPPPTGPAQFDADSSSSHLPPKDLNPAQGIADDIFLDIARPDENGQYAQPEAGTITEAARLGYENYLEHLQLMREKLRRAPLHRAIREIGNNGT